VWGRFSAGREATIRWYRRVYDRLHEVGFDAPIMRELDDAAHDLEAWVPGAAAEAPTRREPLETAADRAPSQTGRPPSATY
jgi:hypothetical protein